MFKFVGRLLGGLPRMLRLISVFAAIVMWLTGRSRQTTRADAPSRTEPRTSSFDAGQPGPIPPMIRSLVMMCNGDADPASPLRRNAPIEGLEAAYADGSLLWIDLVDPVPEELDWLEHTLQLNPLVAQDLRRDDRRPALLVYPTYLFLSLFQPNIQRGEVSGREVHCIIGDTFFVTVRRESAGAVDLAYNRIAQNPESCKRGPAYFLFLTAQHVIDAYYPLLDEISGLMSRLDEELLQGAGRTRQTDAPDGVSPQAAAHQHAPDGRAPA